MKKHRWFRIAAAAAVLLVAVIVLVPFFLNVNTFRSPLETQLSSVLGRKVTLGELSLSLLTGSLGADNVSIADDPAFSSEPFLQAKSLRIGVEILPLLLHRQVRVTSFIVASPSINLVHAANGAWNFSNIGRGAAGGTGNPQQQDALPNLTVGELKIQNGAATVSNLPPTGRTLVYSNLNLEVRQFSFAGNFPFQLAAKLPAGGVLEIHGAAGPVSPRDAADTPLEADLSLRHFDPVAAGAIPPSEGISMLADITARVVSNGQVLGANGAVRAARLRLVPNGAPTPNPVDLAYTIEHNLDARTGVLRDLSIQTGAVAAHIHGSYQMTPTQIMLSLRLAAPGLPIDQMEALLPAVGVRLPSGSRLQGGTLTADLAVNGPTDAITVSGPVQIDNTRLAGFDLGSRIEGLTATGTSSGGTEIQTLRANVTSSPAGTRIDNLYTSAPAIGTATGNGTVSPTGDLNFRVLARVGSGVGIVGQTLGSLLHVAAANGIPITITGTTANPVIRADVSEILRKDAGGVMQQLLGNGNNTNQSGPGGLVNKLFGTH